MSTHTPDLSSATPRTLPILPAEGEGGWFASRDELEPFVRVAAPEGRLGRALWAVAEALFATEQGSPPPARLAWLCAEVHDVLAHIGARARRTFRLALWALTWLAPLVVLRLPPLGRLPVRDRVRALERFERGLLPQSAAVLAVKAIVCILYFEHPDAAREIGFDGRCRSSGERA